MMLERDSELQVAGRAAVSIRARESGREKRRHAGRLAVALLGHGRARWRRDATHSLCASRCPTSEKEHTAIRNNIGPARAWRAPNHPQAAVLTMCALDDLAAKLNMDPCDFFLKNHRH